MSKTLVEKTRERLAALSDEFYEDTFVTDALNVSLKNVFSLLVQKESVSGMSLRSLDILRRRADVAISSYTAYGSSYQAAIAFPTTIGPIDNYTQLNLLKQGSTKGIPLKEIKTDKMHLLQRGLIIPSDWECYYQVERNVSSIGTAATYTVNYTDFSAGTPTVGNVTFSFSYIYNSKKYTFTYTTSISAYTEANVDAYLFALVAAINADDTHHFTASLPNFASANKILQLTAKVNGTEFNNMLSNITQSGFDPLGYTKTAVVSATAPNASTVFRLYSHRNNTSDLLNVNYVTVPASIGEYSLVVSELPARLENAILYGACAILANTERQAPGADGVPPINFVEMFNTELKLNAY